MKQLVVLAIFLLFAFRHSSLASEPRPNVLFIFSDDRAQHASSDYAELFNLATDLGEQNNLAAKEPQGVARLRAELAAWQKQVGAKFATPNLNYEPAKPDGRAAPLLHNGKVIEQPADHTTLTRCYTEQAVKFIRAKKSGPFCLYLAHTFPQVPMFASPAFKGISRAGIYGDSVEELDWSVGELLATLRSEGVAENTLVVFSSPKPESHEPPLLFYLGLDPSEKRNVAADHADVLARIQVAVKAHRATVQAVPQLN